jgi:hypothetical protein
VGELVRTFGHVRRGDRSRALGASHARVDEDLAAKSCPDARASGSFRPTLASFVGEGMRGFEKRQA